MEKRKYDVVCLSDSCCDIIFGGLNKLPAAGGEEFSKSFHVTSGGGSNTPIGLARLGADVAYITAIGNDIFGGIIAESLKESGVSDAFLQRGGNNTWVSAVLSYERDRSFASYMGTPVEFDRSIAEKILPETSHLHSFICYGMKFKHLVPLCAQYGVTVSFDTSYDPQIKLKDIISLLKAAAFFTPNHEEAMQLTDTKTPEDALRILSDYCGYVIITMGADGCIAAKDGKVYKAGAAVIPKVIDTTGAGDLFVSGLLSAYIKKKSITEQLKTASASGTLATAYLGGISEQFSSAGVNKLMENVKVSGEGAFDSGNTL